MPVKTTKTLKVDNMTKLIDKEECKAQRYQANYTQKEALAKAKSIKIIRHA